MRKPKIMSDKQWVKIMSSMLEERIQEAKDMLIKIGKENMAFEILPSNQGISVYSFLFTGIRVSRVETETKAIIEAFPQILKEKVKELPKKEMIKIKKLKEYTGFSFMEDDGDVQRIVDNCKCSVIHVGDAPTRTMEEKEEYIERMKKEGFKNIEETLKITSWIGENIEDGEKVYLHRKEEMKILDFDFSKIQELKGIKKISLGKERDLMEEEQFFSENKKEIEIQELEAQDIEFLIGFLNECNIKVGINFGTL